MKNINYNIKYLYIVDRIDNKEHIEKFYCCKLCKSKFRFVENLDIHFQQFHQDKSSCIFFKVCYQ